MNDKSKLIRTIVLWSLYGLVMIGTILVFCFNTQINGGPLVKVDPMDPSTWVRDPESVFKITTDSAFLKYMVETAVPAIFNTIRIVGIALTFGIALHYFAKLAFHSKKGKTLSRLLVSFFKWVIALCALFFTMDAWGANTTTILASAGVVTLIIGLGSQSLVADILAGIFIVFEGEFQVGDIVIIDGWRGEVKEIGMRTTKLVDAGGNIKIVNNSEIRTIINQTQELSVAKTYVSISEWGELEQLLGAMFSTVWEQMEIPSLYSEDKLYEIFKQFTVEIDKKLNYPTANIMTAAEFKVAWNKVNELNEPQVEVAVNDSTEDAVKNNMKKAPFVFVVVLILGFLFAFLRKRKK